MDIGSGFSKPMIRGMGFNRIGVLENGIKQEGQQWGADHGFELDAFNIGAVNVLKGPSSLLYGCLLYTSIQSVCCLLSVFNIIVATFLLPAYTSTDSMVFKTS